MAEINRSCGAMNLSTPGPFPRLVLGLVVVLVGAGCGQVEDAAGTTTTVLDASSATVSTPSVADSTVVSGPEPTPIADPSPPTTVVAQQPQPDGGLLTLLESLVVEVEQPNGYDRGLFRHWVDADGDGCDTRREVLITEAVTAPTVGGGCGLSAGVWVSRYDGATETGSGRGFDIDHLVPLKEAWDSGAHAWDPATRERFANDLGYEHSLVAVSAASNRSKGAQDPTTWTPPEASQSCWYAAAWIHVKARWELSIDPAEAATLRNLVAGCPDNAADSALPAPIMEESGSAPTTAATGPPEEGCHPDYSPCLPHLEGDALNCGDLTAAQKPVTVRLVGIDPYQLDRDGDGQGCTS